MGETKQSEYEAVWAETGTDEVITQLNNLADYNLDQHKYSTAALLHEAASRLTEVPESA